MNKGDQKLLDDINTYGWHVLRVSDSNDELPNFAYSIGIWHSFKQPEIIIFGLELDDMQIIINQIAESTKELSFISVCRKAWAEPLEQLSPSSVVFAAAPF